MDEIHLRPVPSRPPGFMIAFNNRRVWPPPHMRPVETGSCLDCPAIILFDHPVNRRRHAVPVNDRVVRNSPNPGSMIGVGTVEMIPVNNHRMHAVPVVMDFTGPMRTPMMGHRMRMPSPTAISIKGFIRGQGDPSHMSTGIEPPNPSRIPAKSDIQEGRARINAKPGYRGCPVPETPCEDPVSVMVRQISKGLMGQPDVVPAPPVPSAYGERGPTHADMDGAPERIIGTIIVNILPPAILFKHIGIIVQTGGQIVGRLALVLHSLGPQAISFPVPPIPAWRQSTL